MKADPNDRASLSERWQRGFDWLERELGGRIVRFERQPRWRPAFDLDLERDGQLLPLYWRGDRGTDEGINKVYTLEREARILQVLEEQGLLVPHVHAFCTDPLGIVMDRVPGRANLALCEDEAERRAARDHYIELLVQMHAADPAAFERVGLERPSGAHALGLADFPIWEASYRKCKRRPEPFVEFGARWVHRNVPADRDEVTFVAGDTGQFLYQGGRVTALIDLELAFLGDPAADLGGLRSRDLSEPLGDLSEAIRLYSRLSGRPIDLAAIHFHTVRFLLCTPMATAHFVADPQPGLDVAQYTCWCVAYAQATLEAIAEAMDVALEAPDLPEPTPGRLAPATQALVAGLEAAKTAASGDSYAAYQAESNLRLAQAMDSQERFGPALEADDLAEVGAVVGREFSVWSEADAALEALVREAPAERTEELLHLFYRRVLRQRAIWQPALRELAAVRLPRLDLHP